MRKAYLILVLSVTMLLLLGCQRGAKTTASDPFLGGSEGLKIGFVENAPPAEVFDGGSFPFDILVDLENVGEADVSKDNLKVSITGLFPADFDKSTTDLKGKTTGATLTSAKKSSEGDKIPGTKTQVSFPGLNYKKALQGNTQFPVKAEVCYTYQTKVSSLICLRQDPLGTRAGPCEIAGSKQVFNSGAPVHVASLTESVGGTDKVLFNVKISQQGKGTIHLPVSSCDSSLIKTDRVKVRVDTQTSGLDCLGLQDARKDGNVFEGITILSNGQASFTCTQTTQGVDAVKEVNILLTYDYFDSVEKALLVKHIPGGTSGATTTPSTTTPPTTPTTTTNPCAGITITAGCNNLRFTFPDSTNTYGVYGWKEGGSCPNSDCYFQEPSRTGSFEKTGLPKDTLVHYRIDKPGQTGLCEANVRTLNC